jgi:hypothetical protein
LIDGKPAKNKAKGFGDDKDVRELWFLIS